MIKIDPEFQSLIPPLTDEEYRQLEENIIKEGVRDALVVWPQPDGSDILLDGHNRWEIVNKNDLKCFLKYERMSFESREDAKEWIIRNQLGRRNIPLYVRGELFLRIKPKIEKQIIKEAKERQGTRTDKGNIVQNSARSRDEFAKIAGISHNTLDRIEKIQEKADEETKQALRNGDTSINQVYKDIKAKEWKETHKPAEEVVKERLEESEKAMQEGIVDIQTVRQNRNDRDFLENSSNYEIWKSFERLCREIDKFSKTDKDKMLKAFKSAGMWGVEQKTELSEFSLKYSFDLFTRSTNSIKAVIMEALTDD